jgi:tripartite-type tricarboxylate transporter receptor subunit TctC
MPHLTRRDLLARLGGAAALAAPALPAFGQAASSSSGQGYPAKPIVVKVAFPAGGPADASIRAAGVVLQRNLKQTLVADNQPGANGSISAMSVLKAEPDGYTLLGTTGVDFLVAPLTIASARYQPDAFRLIGVVGISDFVLVTNPRVPVGSVDELIAATKKPGAKEFTYAHWGHGSAPHIVGADFQQRAGIRFLEVPYKGAAPSVTDVAGGQVDFTFVPLGGPTLGMIQTGKLKPIALAADRRNPALPNVPLVAEHPALKDFEYSLWSAVLAPPKTPDAVVARLNTAMNEWIASPENLARITSNASRKLDPMTVAQASAFLKSEHEKYTRVARTLKLQAE